MRVSRDDRRGNRRPSDYDQPAPPPERRPQPPADPGVGYTDDDPQPMGWDRRPPAEQFSYPPATVERPNWSTPEAPDDSGRAGYDPAPFVPRRGPAPTPPPAPARPTSVPTSWSAPPAPAASEGAGWPTQRPDYPPERPEYPPRRPESPSADWAAAGRGPQRADMGSSDFPPAVRTAPPSQSGYDQVGMRETAADTPHEPAGEVASVDAVMKSLYAQMNEKTAERRVPWTWSNLSAAQAQVLEDLVDHFVGEYNRNLVIAPDELIPPCWRRHAVLAQEMPVQFWAWWSAHMDPSGTVLGAQEYYNRHLPAFQQRLATRLLGKNGTACRKGNHPASGDDPVADSLAAFANVDDERAVGRSAANLRARQAVSFGHPKVPGSA